MRRTEKASTNIRVHLDAVTGIVYGNVKSTGPPHRNLHRPIYGGVIGDIKFQHLENKRFPFARA